MTAVLLTACSGSTGLPSLESALNQQEEELVRPRSVIIGDAEAECGFPRSSVVTMLDLVDGAVLWTQPVPWTVDPPTVFGDAVVTVSRFVDRNPPSLSALDPVTGRPLWQRFIATETMGLAAVLESGVVVATEERSFVVVGTDGTAAPLRSAAARSLAGDTPVVLHRVDGGVTVQVPGRPQSIAEAPPDIVAVDADQVLTVEPDTGIARSITSPTWATTSLTSGGFDLPEAAMADSGRVLVSIGSGVGPNARIVVLDAETGGELWSLEGVRGARLDGDVVVYDQRTTAGEAATRIVSVADAATGAKLMSASTGLALGGYVGRSDDALLFTDGQTAVTVKPGQPLPAPMFIGGDPGQPPPPAAVAPALAVVSEGRGVTALGWDAAHQWHASVDRDVRSIIVTGDGVLVWSGDDDYGCG